MIVNKLSGPVLGTRFIDFSHGTPNLGRPSSSVILDYVEAIGRCFRAFESESRRMLIRSPTLIVLLEDPRGCWLKHLLDSQIKTPVAVKILRPGNFFVQQFLLHAELPGNYFAGDKLVFVSVE